MDSNKLIDYLCSAFGDKAQKEYGKNDSVRFLAMEKGIPTGRCLKWKTIDYVNYVHRVSLTVSYSGRELLGMTCTCGEKKGCVHVVAAILHGRENHLIENAFEEEMVDETVSAEKNFDRKAMPKEDVVEETFDGVIPIVIDENFAKDPFLNDTSTAGTPEDVAPVKEEAVPMQDTAKREDIDYLWDGELRQMKVLLGRNLETGESVYWTPNDTEQVFHTNTGIIGTMGTGKTQFTKSLVTQLYREQLAHKNFDGHPYNILIFDYKGDYNESKPEFVEAVDAKVYKPYRLAYNPFSLTRSNSFRPLLPVHTASVFKDTLTKSFHLGPKQQQLLLDCILAAYARCGILAEDESTWDRMAPTFEQVYEIFVERTENKVGDSLAAAMNKLYQFRIFSSDPANTISIDQFIRGVTVLDLSGYDGDIQSFVVAITMDQFYANMLKSGSSKTDGRYRQLNTLILVDEADNFMKEDFPSLRKIMKEGREFGVGMILSTQSLNHFVGGEDDYSRYILTWVIHNVSDLSQREVEYIYKLQPKSQEILDLYGGIKSLAKHESILKIANSKPTKIRDKAFYELMKEDCGEIAENSDGIVPDRLAPSAPITKNEDPPKEVDERNEVRTGTGFVTKNSSEWLSAEEIESWYREKPNHTIYDLICKESDRERMIMAAETPFVDDPVVHSFKGGEPRELMLYGLPATGKTYAAEAIFNYIMTKYENVKLIHMRASEIFSPFVGEAERRIQAVFREAIDNAPSILFFDDVDQIVRSRLDVDKSYLRNITNTFLEAFHNLQNTNKPVLLVTATASPWTVDESFMKRITSKIPVFLPDEETRRQFLEKYIGFIKCDDIDYEKMAKDMERFNFRDLYYFVDRVRCMVMQKVTELIAMGTMSSVEYDSLVQKAIKKGLVEMNQELYYSVRAQISPSTTAEERQKMEEYISTWA